MKNDKQKPERGERKSLADIVGRNERMPDICNYIYLKEPDESDIEWAKNIIQSLQAPLSNETKVVESVREAAKAEMGVAYEPHMSQTDQSFIQGAEFGANWQFKNTDAVNTMLHHLTDEELLLSMQQYARQQNTDAVKVVTDRINHYGNKGATSRSEENKDFAIWNELNHILKLIQP